MLEIHCPTRGILELLMGDNKDIVSKILDLFNNKAGKYYLDVNRLKYYLLDNNDKDGIIGNIKNKVYYKYNTEKSLDFSLFTKEEQKFILELIKNK